MKNIERALVRNVFNKHYKDLYVYRWLNRNKDWLQKLFAVSGVVVNVLAMLEIYTPLIVWAFTFIGIIWIGAIDHFYIGIRFKKILSELEKQNINIGLVTLLEICKNEIPE
jgi:hypothetical protein